MEKNLCKVSVLLPIKATAEYALAEGHIIIDTLATNETLRLLLILVEPGVLEEIVHGRPQLLVLDQALLDEVDAVLCAVVENFLPKLRFLVEDGVVEAKWRPRREPKGCLAGEHLVG